MKLLMLGASLISIANFATASSEEGIIPEEVVEEEFLPPPYRYSGDNINSLAIVEGKKEGIFIVKHVRYAMTQEVSVPWIFL